jgi:hypothetical protein
LLGSGFDSGWVVVVAGFPNPLTVDKDFYKMEVGRLYQQPIDGKDALTPGITMKCALNP